MSDNQRPYGDNHSVVQETLEPTRNELACASEVLKSAEDIGFNGICYFFFDYSSQYGWYTAHPVR